MKRIPKPTLAGAFDAARFGPARTLDLRTGLPTVAQALARAEPWLRERQVAKAGEVLVVTGRGAGSPDGIGAIRRAVAELLARLKRMGVVRATRDHTPGSVIVELAPIRALFETGPRSRGPRPPEVALPSPVELSALDAETREDLRLLAEYSLASLGVPARPAFVEDEMLRQFSILARCIAPDESDRAARLKFLASAARLAFEDP